MYFLNGKVEICAQPGRHGRLAVKGGVHYGMVPIPQAWHEGFNEPDGSQLHPFDLFSFSRQGPLVGRGQSRALCVAPHTPMAVNIPSRNPWTSVRGGEGAGF